MPRPFEGLRVLDLTHVLAGPFCAYQLAVLGADVIKIEPVGCPDPTRGRGPDDTKNAAGMGLTYQVQAGNKRAISLNLKVPDGAEILKRLIAGADVFIENYRTGAMAEIGFDYESVRVIKFDIVYCSLTGYGQTGPRAKTNAYDNVIQATSGIMDRSGGVKTAASIVDYTAGMSAAFAISAALYRRRNEGQGVHIDCAMLDAALMLAAPELSAVLSAKGMEGKRSEAGIGCYETADGRLMVGAFNFRQNARLWKLLGEPAFADFDDWPAIWSASDAMRLKLTEILLTRSADNWVEIFHQAGIPAEKVRSLEEAAVDPHLAHRPLLRQVDSQQGGKATVPVASFGFSEDGPDLTLPPPSFGEHTHDVLRELGYSDGDIAAFATAGVIL